MDNSALTGQSDKSGRLEHEKHGVSGQSADSLTDQGTQRRRSAAATQSSPLHYTYGDNDVTSFRIYASSGWVAR